MGRPKVYREPDRDPLKRLVDSETARVRRLEDRLKDCALARDICSLAKKPAQRRKFADRCSWLAHQLVVGRNALSEHREALRGAEHDVRFQNDYVDSLYLKYGHSQGGRYKVRSGRGLDSAERQALFRARRRAEKEELREEIEQALEAAGGYCHEDWLVAAQSCLERLRSTYELALADYEADRTPALRREYLSSKADYQALASALGEEA